jgi:hypothetical protein
MNFICATVPVLKIAFMIQARLPAFKSMRKPDAIA